METTSESAFEKSNNIHKLYLKDLNIKKILEWNGNLICKKSNRIRVEDDKMSPPSKCLT